MAKNSGKGGILITNGFPELLEKIKEAQGNVEEAAWTAARKSASVMLQTLKEECDASGVPQSVSGAITANAVRDESGQRMAAEVGWRMGEYDPKNLSQGYKAVFLNYGTPRRATRSGYNRGYITGRGFIGRAKKKARPKIKKAQQEALESILKELTE